MLIHLIDNINTMKGAIAALTDCIEEEAGGLNTDKSKHIFRILCINGIVMSRHQSA
jgi:hypothetical protein